MASLTELRQVFFQECEEQLEELTDGLAEIESLEPGDQPDPETINRMFRAVHSIKGGAASFSLDSITEYAHAFETVLDELRSNLLEVTRDLVQVFYRASDRLADLITMGASDESMDPATLADYIREVMALSSKPQADPDDDPHAGEEDVSTAFVPLALDFSIEPIAEPVPVSGDFTIAFTPTAAMYANGHEPVHLFRELETLGALTVTPVIDVAQPWNAPDPAIVWNMSLTTESTESEIEEILEFAKAFAQIDIRKAEAAQPDFSNGGGPSSDVVAFPTTQEVPSASDAPQPRAPARPEKEAKPASDEGEGDKSKAAKGNKATVRVDMELVDELINMVGELVITQSVMSQSITESVLSDGRELTSTLEDFKTLTRRIQEGVMAIRAQSVKPLFQRMGRIVRETAQIAEKDVRFIIEGEDTEVDRTVIERLVDPLTHIIRNSIDHGLERADRRKEVGKETTGSVTLSAAHRSGRVVIEVRDDGAGVNREKVLSSAIQKGLVSESAQLSDGEIDRLLFLPGFSTASAVTSLSGRGVGMDVVNSEIRKLGGRVSIISNPGTGTTISISLPLTLAVLDGMVVDVANETMVVPISAIVETIRPDPSQLHMIGPVTRMVAVRDRMVPVIDLGSIFGFQADLAAPSDTVLLLVEDDKGDQYALTVDRIRDQRQVVIKSLEANYGHIPYVAAATILGDGQIALIVDLDEITHQRSAGNTIAAAIKEGFRVNTDTMASKGGKSELITFSIGEQDFCMDIMLVREIRGWTRVTMLPHSPDDVLGVMNLRGAVVPIVDLSARLGLGPCKHESRDVIIIALIGTQTVGFLVSAVSDIVGISPEEIQPMPKVEGLEENNFVKGIIASDERTLRVLDINALASSMITEPVTA